MTESFEQICIKHKIILRARSGRIGACQNAQTSFSIHYIEINCTCPNKVLFDYAASCCLRKSDDAPIFMWKNLLNKPLPLQACMITHFGLPFITSKGLCDNFLYTSVR